MSNEELGDPFGTTVEEITFEEADTPEEIEHAVVGRFLDVCTDAEEHGIDPMVVAQELHDLSETLKIELHLSSLRAQYTEEMNDGGNDSDGSDSDGGGTGLLENDHPL